MFKVIGNVVHCVSHGALAPSLAKVHFSTTHQKKMRDPVHLQFYSELDSILVSCKKQDFDSRVQFVKEAHNGQCWVPFVDGLDLEQVFVCCVCPGMTWRTMEEDMKKHVRVHDSSNSNPYKLANTQCLVACKRQSRFIVKTVREQAETELLDAFALDTWSKQVDELMKDFEPSDQATYGSLLGADLVAMFSVSGETKNRVLCDLFEIDESNVANKCIRAGCERFLCDLQKEIADADPALLFALKAGEGDEFARIGGLTPKTFEGTARELNALRRLDSVFRYAVVVADLFCIRKRIKQSYGENDEDDDVLRAGRLMFNERPASVYLWEAIDKVISWVDSHDELILGEGLDNEFRELLHSALLGLFDSWVPFGTCTSSLPVVRYVCFRAKCAGVQSVKEADSTKLGNVHFACDAFTHLGAVMKHVARGVVLREQSKRFLSTIPVEEPLRVLGADSDVLKRVCLDADLMNVLSLQIRTPFRAICELSNRGYKVIKRVTTLHHVVVHDAGPGELVGSSIQVGKDRVELRDIRSAISNMESNVDSSMRRLLGEVVYDELQLLDVKALQDDLSDSMPGLGLLARKPILKLCAMLTGHIWTEICHVSSDEPVIDELKAKWLRVWKLEAINLTQLLCTLVHCLGVPARATEIVSGIFLNSTTQLRSLFVADGRVFIHYAYHKTLSKNVGASKVLRFMPRYLSRLVLGVLLVIRTGLQFAMKKLDAYEGATERISLEYALVRQGSLFLYQDTPGGAAGLRRNFAKLLLLHSGGTVSLTFQQWRHFAAAVTRYNMNPTAQLVGAHAIVVSLSMNHGVTTAATSYAVNSQDTLAGGLCNADEFSAYLLGSRIHLATLGFDDVGHLPHPLALPEDLVPLFILPVDKNSKKRRRFGQSTSATTEEGEEEEEERRVVFTNRDVVLESKIGHLCSQVGMLSDLVLTNSNVKGIVSEFLSGASIVESIHTPIPLSLLSECKFAAASALGVQSDIFEYRSPEQAVAVQTAWLTATHADYVAGRPWTIAFISGTGSGKSLTFLAAAVGAAKCNTKIIVVVPFRALLQQHVSQGQALLGEEGCQAWGSSKHMAQASLVVVMMENFVTNDCVAWANENCVLCVVDEGHVMITETRYRLAARGLAAALSTLHIRRMILSATLSRQDTAAIGEQLGVSRTDWTSCRLGVIRSARTIRRNVQVNVQYKEHEHNAIVCTSELIHQHRAQGDVRLVFVFCNTVGLANKAMVKLRILGHPDALVYHGRLCVEAKDSVYQRLIREPSKVLVCTSSFGTGMDFNVGLGFMLGCPTDLHTWVQQTGRIGRDGSNEAKMYMFLWGNPENEMNLAFGAGHVPEDVRLMSNVNICLLSVATQRFDDVEGLVCGTSKSFTSCSACIRGGSNSIRIDEGLGFVIPSQLRINARAHHQNARACLKRFWELLNWAVSVHSCFRCMINVSGGESAILLCSGVQSKHGAGSCWTCQTHSCRGQDCPMAVLKGVPGTCTRCLLPFKIYGVDTHAPLVTTARFRRAQTFEQFYTSSPDRACKSGLQSFFGGLFRASVSHRLRTCQGIEPSVLMIRETVAICAGQLATSRDGICRLVIDFLAPIAHSDWV
jgi:superfamily II DNA or RNA helicase